MYATCEWYKCGVEKLRKDFIGKKRFCSSKCAHAFSGSRGNRGGKEEKKVKREKVIVKKSEPRSRVRRQQRNRGTAADSQEVAAEIETPAEIPEFVYFVKYCN